MDSTKNKGFGGLVYLARRIPLCYSDNLCGGLSKFLRTALVQPAHHYQKF